MTAPPVPWTQAMRALAALAVDPDGLGGLVLRARAGPVRQALEDGFGTLPLPVRRIHPGLGDTQLFGGLNVAESLARGRMIRDSGLADTPAALVLSMAERTPPGLAARLGQVLDARRGHALIVLDEGADPDETVPPGLAERLAFHLDLGTVRAPEARLRLPAPADLDSARTRLGTVAMPAGLTQRLVALAACFGIDSLRAPLLACRVARALAALDAEPDVTEDHVREAAELVYPARATRMPQPPEDATDDPPADPPADPPEDGDTPGTGRDRHTDIPDEMLIAAVAARLPPDVLAHLAHRRARRPPGRGGGAGARKTGNRRGRPLPSRPGHPDGRARIDIIATLRAAAPWQRLRRQLRADGARLVLRPSDIRLRRFEDRSDRLVIFAVDASGSAAMARMAEAKGAVELMLAQAYARRDHVALVAFRGTVAEMLLAPTRSLVQAKRRLAGLPGGGGTPLAAGLRAAFELSRQGQHHGLSPALALLTDGRANIALDGSPGRAAARADAETIARHFGAQRLPGVVIDTSPRPGADGTALAGWLGAQYLALPRADARRISSAADTALRG